MDTIPEMLKGPFEEQFLTPLRQRQRSEDIQKQRQLDREIQQAQAVAEQRRQAFDDAKQKRTKVEERLRTVEAELKAANAVFERTKWELFEAVSAVDSLKSTKARHCSPLLVEFINEMITKWYELRNQIRVEERDGKRNLLTNKVKTSIYSNVQAVSRAIEYIRGAIAAAEKLKAEPLTDEQIKSRLEELRKAIPSHHTWTRVEVSPAIFIEKDYLRYNDEFSQERSIYQ